MSNHASPSRTIFLYTEEQRGKQLVESVVLGMLSDISGSEKYIVVQDPESRVQFVYRILHDISNLDAAAIIDQPPDAFDGRTTVQLSGIHFRLGSPENALRLLRGKADWIQDKGCVLSVLLQNAAARRPILISRGIPRERLTRLPRGVPIEYLAHRFASGDLLAEHAAGAAPGREAGAQEP